MECDFLFPVLYTEIVSSGSPESMSHALKVGDGSLLFLEGLLDVGLQYCL